jgi:hypothetical protein
MNKLIHVLPTNILFGATLLFMIKSPILVFLKISVSIFMWHGVE